MNAAAPIGMFDSGLGGLSIWKAVRKQLPNESLLYFADQARCPYGPRSQSEIIRFSCEITEILLAKGAKMMIVACNTATAAAIEVLRATYAIPFVGLEPALKPAAAHTQTGTVGILATEGTFRGNHFKETRARYAANLNLLMQVGHGLVALVESGQLKGPEANALLRRYLEPMLAAGADQIVLGCTHYPFLQEAMAPIVEGKAAILNPAPAVAAQVDRMLRASGLQNEAQSPHDLFFTSGKVPFFQQQLSRLLAAPVTVNQVEWYQLP